MNSSFRSKLNAAVSLLAVLFSCSLLARAQGVPTRTTLSVAGNDLRAQVVDALGNPVHAGVVSFLEGDGSRSMGSAMVDETGHAVLHPGALPAQVRVTAQFAGSGFAASKSSPATVVSSVTGIPSFSITASPSSITTAQGGFATTVITITPINDFSESVQLSCSGLPGQAFCSFTPDIGSTSPTGTNTQPQPFTSTLQISTQAASGAVTPPRFGQPGLRLPSALALAFPGILALAGVAAARRRAFRGGRFLALLAVAAGMLTMAGCSQRYGYLKHPPSVAEGTPLGTYPITISASGNDGSSVTNNQISITLAVTAQ
jgi:hypothetical protein